MKTVQVLLRESVDHLGKVGDVVDVATGYARNYLLPRKLAVDATAENVRMMSRRRAKLDAEEEAMQADLDARVARLEGVVVKTTQTADEGGTLYGSVNAGLIARLLGEAGHAVEERDVRLGEPIKSVGEHEVAVHVHGERSATIRVVVEAAAG